MSEIQTKVNLRVISGNNPVYRKDVLTIMLQNTHLKSKELFDLLIKENKESCDKSRMGWLFETICQILIILKCVEHIDYTELYEGQLQCLKKIDNINSILKTKVSGGGNNPVDFTIKQLNTWIHFTIKYREKFGETDVSSIKGTITDQEIHTDYKIALICMNKRIFQDHRYNNEKSNNKLLHDKMIQDGLLFDETDVIKALDVFCQRFSNNTLCINEFIEFVNTEYLLSPRKQLTKRMHQQMTLKNFITSFLAGLMIHCIAHDPRSGKSITILLMCKYLLECIGYKRILIMTSVPATIDSFTKDLEKYIDFMGIDYKLQDDIDSIEKSFNGIIFCSVQYLKTNPDKKKEYLRKLSFDAIIADESQQGSSTDKTKTDILDNHITDIRKNVKLTMFASGTSNKTIKFYNIPNSGIYKWGVQEDVSYMKRLLDKDISDNERKDIIEYMTNRHGPEFKECLENETLNHDYSKFPTQVLMKQSFPQSLIDDMNTYNNKNGTNYGNSSASILALTQIRNNKGEVEYTEDFEICKDNDGENIMEDFLDGIISSNRMRNTIMKQIEHTQTKRGSRKSTKENPLLFIIYLPTHTRNNTISKLQKALIKFLHKHNLWVNYNIEYSNANHDSGDVSEEYTKYLQTIMDKTKKEQKQGCILLLGNKGGVGITYHHCDVTISLDDGHNIDNQKQRYFRCLTEADGKTIGINVDMNVQRTYMILNDIIQKHRKITKTKKTNAEILYYLFEQNIFLFDPHEFKNGVTKIDDIKSYYDSIAVDLMKELDDTLILENLICDEDDMRNFIKKDFDTKNNKKINKELEGLHQDCPKGGITKTEIDAPTNAVDTTENNDKSLTTENNDKSLTTENIITINKTREMAKRIIPLLIMISKKYKIYDLKEIFTNIKTKDIIKDLLKDQKIEIKDNYNIIVNIMNNIIDNNVEIINNIREIYTIASSNKLRELIEKHFIPTPDEKKRNAEVPTPVILVNDMLNSPPSEFWKKPHKVFEPCCGKGNFVLGVFDKFYKGLEEMYPDEIERCRVIMTECIYYADLTALNVFITTEILKCHIQSYCGLDELDYEFNYYIGDTLKFNFKDKWNIIGFNMICGNPPYNANGDTATGNTIWQYFTIKALNEWLIQGGYLLFVHPPGWRKPNTERGKFTQMFNMMTKENQMLYLEIHGIKDGKKVFKCGTRYDWYLIEKINQYKNTKIVDEDGKQNEIILSELSWLPNSNILEINKILAKNDESRCPIMQSMSAYEPRKKWMSSNETPEFKYPCVHSTPKAGIRYKYSSLNDRGHFGISKVIFGDSGIYNPVIDMDGKYGMTQHSMAIQVDNLEEATYIRKVIESDKFDKIIQSCLYSSYAIDWNIFKEFNKDFWKEFI